MLNINESNISIDDNFFDLGGDSLNAINLSAKIYSKFNIEIFVKDILEYPIISDLSDLISSKISNTSSTSIEKIKEAEEFFRTEMEKEFYYSAYAACFSKFRDDASQWERYGHYGQGVCIAFHEDMMEKMTGGG